MFGRVVEAVVSMFKPRPSEPEGVALPADNPAPAALARSGEHAFASRLQSLVDGSDAEKALVAGSLELVGLDELRKAMGNDWAQVADRVKDLAELELQLQLEGADFYRQYSDTLFLVCFSNLDKDAADQKARQIRARIKAALIKHIPEIAHAIDVDLWVAEINRGGLRQGDVPIANSLLASLQKVRDEAKHTALDFKSLLFRDMQVVFAPAWHTGKRMVVF
ncbi:MAG TPA: hypothetical protein VGO70_08400, partial [Arsenicitalea sp.]|nr:hypothetical protein [Arsenicitalea sp.]